MSKLNIIKILYKNSPMNFYYYTVEEDTVIKSVNNTSLGYKFKKLFSKSELDKVWSSIRLHKRISTVLIFLVFVTILYKIIFPNYALLIDSNLNLSILTIVTAIIFVYFGITFVSTKVFEKRLEKMFGKFEKTKFIKNSEVDECFYKIFKTELIKVSVLLLLIFMLIFFASPVKKAYNAISQGQYKKTISITTLGSVVFPILPDWYSLRGYARFQLGDYENAINDYDKAYRFGTDFFNTMNFDNKIYIKYFLKDYESAIKDFDDEIKNANSDYERDSFLWDKAQFLYNVNRYEEALALYTELLTKADSDSVFLLKDRLYLERAQIYQILGQNDLANADLINSGAVETLENKLDYIPKPVLLLKEL